MTEPFALELVSMRRDEPTAPQPVTRLAGNPFRIEGPAIINVSGGRTSGYMLWHILQAHGGRLPLDVLPVFQNTGQEREGTLVFLREMADRWGVTIHWVEYASKGRGREFCRVVDFETAARRGQYGPFDQLIDDRGQVPSHRFRFCTQALKVLVSELFMRGLGFTDDAGGDAFDRVIGVRADEPRRVSRLRAYDSILLPLASAGVSRADVDRFWSTQSFDLDLGGESSNCVHCPLRGWTNLVGIEQRQPGSLDWAIEQEQKVGRRWASQWSMVDVVRAARTQPLVSAATPAGIDCLCGSGE